MAYEKLSKLLWALIHQTENGSLTWEGTAADGVYQVSFPRYTVQLSTRDAENADALDFVLTILNSDGTVIEQAADPDFEGGVDHAYQQMKQLYETARRQALGVEAALDDLLGEISKKLPF